LWGTFGERLLPFGERLLPSGLVFLSAVQKREGQAVQNGTIAFFVCLPHEGKDGRKWGAEEGIWTQEEGHTWR